MKSLLFVLSLLFATEAFSYNLDLVEPTKVTMEFEKYDILRDPYIPEDTKLWSYGYALGTQFTLIGKRNEWRLFWDPTLKFRATESQVREGSLYYELGGEYLGKERDLRVFRRHESRHVMEEHRDTRTYPLLDSWVMQLSWKLKK